MSTTNQSNGKKTSSTSNSTTNTPSTTPVLTIANSSNNQTPVQSTTPNNAPKYGTLVPNRVFVGGISANTTETELLQLFSNYGTVKAAKIIQDRAGVSRGYGFITFESEEEAKRLQREADNIVLRERKLNIAPAIKKQPFSRAFDVSSPPTITSGGPAQYFIPANGVPFYQGGVTYFQPQATSADHATQQPPVYQPPTMFPAQSGPPQTATYPSIVYPTQPLYMPQQFPYQPVPYEYNYYPNGGPQYMVGSQGSTQSQPPSMQAPGSPPRTPCYNPQLSYNSDPVYYNIPMYGTMDGSALYQEPMDMANGNLAEDSSYTSTPYTITTEGETSPINNNVENTFEHSSIRLSTTPTSIDKSRQSSTPVVSLLSLDHQEKDFTAMQSGRRRKLVEPVITSATNHRLNSPVSSNFRHNYVHTVNNSQNVTTIPPPNQLNGYLTYSLPSQQFYNSRYRRNLHNNSTSDKFNCYNKRCAGNTENFGTNSNTAGLVDENLNEQKSFSTFSNTFSSASHSPYVENGFVDTKYSNIRNHQNGRNTRGDIDFNVRSHNTYLNKTMHYRNSNSNYKKLNSHSSNKNNAANKLEESKRLGFSNAHDFVAQGNNTTSDENHTSDLPKDPVNTNNPNLLSAPSQIPVCGPHNFIPPARRTRRSVRRSTHAGAPLSEIGAGDAPIPTTELADTCKKLDNLKL